MTEDNFLARWSRRKRDVAKAETEPRVEPKPAESAPASNAAQKSEPEFDVTNLPPLDSINALTDITAFLRAGVPQELTRAALRRVWTTDPSIRDFVGLAENAWDFTDPTAMPGFGPLESTEELRRMVARVVDQIGRMAESNATEAEQSPSDSKELTEHRATDEPLRLAGTSDAADQEAPDASTDSQVSPQSNKVDVAAQHDAPESEKAFAEPSRRSHGGALPR
jgi:hypothetical protein